MRKPKVHHRETETAHEAFAVWHPEVDRPMVSQSSTSGVSAAAWGIFRTADGAASVCKMVSPLCKVRRVMIVPIPEPITIASKRRAKR